MFSFLFQCSRSYSNVLIPIPLGGVLRELWYLARFIIIAFVITTFISSALFTQMKGGSKCVGGWVGVVIL